MREDQRITRWCVRAGVTCLAGLVLVAISGLEPLRTRGEAVTLAADALMLTGITLMVIGLVMWTCAAVVETWRTIREYRR